jgi:hypothetical protein
VANSGKASATSSTIITGEPNEFVRQIHTRMPVILPEEHRDAWFSGAAGKEILVPYPADRMKAWPISARVNSPKNAAAEIIAPVELNTGAVGGISTMVFSRTFYGQNVRWFQKIQRPAAHSVGNDPAKRFST